jgi:hypothetical protein
MTESIRLQTEASAGDPHSPVRQNPAVAHCCQLWDDVFQAELVHEKREYYARGPADKAYRNAMPPLSGYQNICDFIACVAHGIVIGAIAEDCGSKLLYAAQIAIGAVRNQPKPLPNVPTPYPLPPVSL